LTNKEHDTVKMIISLFTAVLLIQVLLFVVNAIGAKTINELV